MIFCDEGDEGEIYIHLRVSIASTVTAQAMRNVGKVQPFFALEACLTMPDLKASGGDCFGSYVQQDIGWLKYER